MPSKWTKEKPFTPDPGQMALWPAVSGNEVNGLGEEKVRPPSPVYWHDPATIPHGPLQQWFYDYNHADELNELRAVRDRIIATPLSPLAKAPAERSPEEWVRLIREHVRDGVADQFGITRMRPEWVFDGYEVASKWIVILAVAMDYDELSKAPDLPCVVEVIRQYARGQEAAQNLASWFREQGWEAHPHCGPLAGPVLLIPPAVECGIGELGKHGSLISRRFGASFRLASVLTDAPLNADSPYSFGVDDFCGRCHACEDACPPEAIFSEKQTVRGSRKWYVDFDQCLPYFNQTNGCGICLAACPWSIPGVPDRLIAKLARRNAEAAA